MADARLRKFDAVLVWKLDRFGRSLVHCVSALQELQAVGIRFIAISQGLDTDESNPVSKLLMHILAADAQFERELIRERVSAGMRSAKAHGTKSGNAIGPPKANLRPRRSCSATRIWSGHREDSPGDADRCRDSG
ncbi:MAG: Resolvase domain protein [Bryobacterales bacterium]|nr:Resolvase domain protein [Bryobacterales bacterium]